MVRHRRIQEIRGSSSCRATETGKCQKQVRQTPRWCPEANCGAAEQCRGRTDAENSWNDLLRGFLHELSQPGERREKWQQIWRVFVDHPWYREELDTLARRALRRMRAPRDWHEDVKQEVLLLLAEKLYRWPDLHLDPQRIRKHFGGWMATIIGRDCQRAVQRLWRQNPPHGALYESSAWVDETNLCDARIDFESTLRELDDPEGTVLVLYAKGYSVKEIAQALGLSNRKTYRVLNHGMLVLERTLSRDRIGWDSHEFPYEE